MSIKIYSTPTCPYCKMVKEYLSSQEVQYQEVDVSADKKSLDEMVKISGQMGVPVVVINDKVVIGFDRDKIEALLTKG